MYTNKTKQNKLDGIFVTRFQRIWHTVFSLSLLVLPIFFWSKKSRPWKAKRKTTLRVHWWSDRLRWRFKDAPFFFYIIAVKKEFGSRCVVVVRRFMGWRYTTIHSILTTESNRALRATRNCGRVFNVYSTPGQAQRWIVAFTTCYKTSGLSARDFV